jgi:hypothetical protein
MLRLESFLGQFLKSSNLYQKSNFTDFEIRIDFKLLPILGLLLILGFYRFF